MLRGGTALSPACGSSLAAVHTCPSGVVGPGGGASLSRPPRGAWQQPHDPPPSMNGVGATLSPPLRLAGDEDKHQPCQGGDSQKHANLEQAVGWPIIAVFATAEQERPGDQQGDPVDQRQQRFAEFGTFSAAYVV